MKKLLNLIADVLEFLAEILSKASTWVNGGPPIHARIRKLRKTVRSLAKTYGFDPKQVHRGDIVYGCSGHPLWDGHLTQKDEMNIMPMYVVGITDDGPVVVARSATTIDRTATGATFPWLVPWHFIAFNVHQHIRSQRSLMEHHFTYEAACLMDAALQDAETWATDKTSWKGKDELRSTLIRLEQDSLRDRYRQDD